MISKLNPNAPSFVSKSDTLEDIKLEDILTPVPYQWNGSHVNGGDGNLRVFCKDEEDTNNIWVGAEELAS